MNELPDIVILQHAKELLVDVGMLSPTQAETFLSGHQLEKIDSDGSTRRFWRIRAHDNEICIIAAPFGKSDDELAESRAAWEIGSHLFERGVPIPKIYAWHQDTGLLIFEDLGDTRLHDVHKNGSLNEISQRELVTKYYRNSLEHLAAMQFKGGVGFDESWCWDSSRYNVELMIEKESDYFLRAFWQGFLGFEVEAGVEEELSQVAHLASLAPNEFFLHRDFQSRNIMVKDGKVRFIDFQGGRLGPLGYDVASLLIDPYCGLPESMQAELLDYYVEEIGNYLSLDENQFRKEYKLLAFQRNMQIIGAFSFLSKVRKKPFFQEFLQPALQTLERRLIDPLFKDFPCIRTMITRGLKELRTS